MFQFFLLTLMVSACFGEVPHVDIGALFVQVDKDPAFAVKRMSTIWEYYLQQKRTEKQAKGKKAPNQFELSSNTEYLESVVGRQRIKSLQKTLKSQRHVSARLLDVIKAYYMAAFTALQKFVESKLEYVDDSRRDPFMAIWNQHLGTPWKAKYHDNWGKLVGRILNKPNQPGMKDAIEEMSAEFANWTQKGSWKSKRYMARRGARPSR